MLDFLPTEQHNEVLAIYRRQVLGRVCVCGEEKAGEWHPFCPACCNRLADVGAGRCVNQLHRFLYSPSTRDFDWREWENCLELLDGIRTGRWTGKKVKSLESD